MNEESGTNPHGTPESAPWSPWAMPPASDPAPAEPSWTAPLASNPAPAEPSWSAAASSPWAPSAPPAAPPADPAPTAEVPPVFGAPPAFDTGPSASDAPPPGPPSGPPLGGTPPFGSLPPFGDVGAVPVPTQPVRANRGGRFVLGVVIGALVGALVASGIYLAFGRDGGSTTTVTRTVNNGPNVRLTGTPTDVKGVLAKVEPAVVAIRTNNSAGSGFVVTADGYIITNNHVVAEAAGGPVQANFTDGTSRAATVVGTDPTTDLAVIKVDATGLEIAELGDSDAVQVGDDVVAVGNALALEGGPTVTTGIISALNRSIETEGESLSGLLQTDAAISSGNSGGPLANAAGQVIGINTAVYSSQGQTAANNIGFAIPINQAKAEFEVLKQGAMVKTAYLGVNTATVTDAVRRETGIKVDSGAYVTDVGSGTPAEGAGIREGDVITAIDGKTVKSQGDVVTAIRGRKPGDKVTITVNRNGSEQSITVTLGERPGR